MASRLIEKNLIPLDKSWIIRLGVLDLINNSDYILEFLEKQKDLSDDLLALKKVSEIWHSKKEINVGESATLFRFLQFVSWKYNLNKKFIKKGTLKNRELTNDPKIINYSLKDLLKLDNYTSQWASASILCGNKEMISNPPFKLKLTYDAVEHWNDQKSKNQNWIEKYDSTILNQAESFQKLLQINKLEFIPKHSEDYCFARAFKLITPQEAEIKWPSLRGHESNRIEEMEIQIKNFEDGKIIDSKDHRVIQAIAMLSLYQNKPIKFSYPNSVSKSWPQFWKFMDFVEQ